MSNVCVGIDATIEIGVIAKFGKVVKLKPGE